MLTTMKAATALLVLAGGALLLPVRSSAQGETEVCTCTCSLKRKDGTRVVVDTINGAACTPCDDSCCGGLCAPVLRRELARRKAEKADRRGSPEAAGQPPPASEKQVAETVAGLRPLLTFDRAARDAQDPRYGHCPSRCGCKGVCTETCLGTCYAYGEKDARPEGSGIDCSGLIAQENPCFWYKDCGKGASYPVLDCKSKECAGKRGAEMELIMLQTHEPPLDHKHRARDVGAGDVVFLSAKDGRVRHVVQVVDQPICGDSGCLMTIAEAPKSGSAVQNGYVFIDLNGAYSRVVRHADGKWRLDGTAFRMEAAGTPPPVVTTGESK